MKKLITSILLGVCFLAPSAWADNQAIDSLNELLRGERSAVETYQQALDKVGQTPEAATLRTQLENHKKAVTDISAEIQRLGGKPDQSSGAWGTWASTVTGTAKLFGDSAALKALKEGEEHGVKEYQEVLEDRAVPTEFKDKVRETYLPQQRKHIANIDAWLNKLS